MRIAWLLAALASSLALALLHRYFLAHFLFWRYPWSDTILHFIGGFTIGIFLAGLFHGKWRPKTYLLLMAVALIGWEIFEYVFHITFNSRAYFLDTSSDLLFGVIGAVLAYVIARFSIWRSA